MNYFGKTDLGKSRTENQDAFSAEIFDSDTALFIVCDGVGGSKGGEVASSIACSVFQNSVRNQILPLLSNKKTQIPESTVKFILIHALHDANEAICEKARSNESLIEMSTTMVSMLIIKRVAYILNVGDSRAYLCSEDGLTQITKDHSYVQDLIDHGKLDPSMASEHSHKNIITRSIGYNTNSTPDLYKVTVERNKSDSFVLCTDGLTNMVNGSEIQKIICSFGSLKSKSEKLINLANSHGGYDNITVLLISDIR